MRARLLPALAVLAAALLAPSAAFAAGQPVITSPATPTSATNVAPSLTWGEVPDATLGYHVRRADGDCASNPVVFTTPPGGDIPFVSGPISFPDTSATEGTYCYLVQSDDGFTTDSDPVTITYDTSAPSGSMTAPANGATLTTPVSVTASASDSGSGVASVTFEATPTGLASWSAIGTSTTAPYGISWSPADGTYDIRAVITDAAGNPTTSTSVVGVVVDGTDPSGSVTSPAGGAILHGTTNALTASASDVGSSVSSVEFERSNGVGWTSISTSSSPPYTANWDTTGLNGSFNLRVVVTDAATNTFSSAPVAVTVDNTAPTGSVTSPTGGAILHGTTNALAASASDAASGVTSVEFQRSNGVGWTSISTSSSAPYTANWDTTGLNGSFNLRVVVTDGSTNTFSSAPVAVTVDNTAPTATLTSPASGAVIRGAAVVTDATASDGGTGVASVAFQISPAGANTWTTYDTDSSPAYHGTLNTTTLAGGDGLYDLRAVATDGATNSAPSALATNVRVDNTQPVVTLSGVATNAKVRGSLSLSATASDAGSGVQSVAFEYRLGSSGPFTPIGSPDTTSPYGPVSFDSTLVADGTYEFHALATDVAGNTLADVETNVLVDNTQPAVVLGGVATNGKVRGSLSLSATASDAGSGVQSVAFEYRLGSSGPFTPIGSPDTTSPYGPVSFDTTGVADGTYQIRALATDVAGNSLADVATNVLVDNTLPAVTLSGVATNAKVRGSLSLSATASDAGSGVQSVAFEYRLGSSGAFLPIGSPDTTAPYGPVSFDTTLVTDGTYEIRALATDVAGNPRASTATNVLVDNTRPTVTIGGVAAGQAVSGTLTLSATAADTGGSGVSSVQFGRRTSGSGGAFTNISSALTTEPFDASFATTLVPDGSYEIQALATDVAGNTQSDSVLNVLVDNTLPSTPAKPTGLSPVSAAPTITFVPVSDPGASASGIDHYDVYRNSGLTPINAAPIPAGGPYTWSDAGAASTSPALTQGTYTYRVVAVDVAGNQSGFSSGLSILLDPLSQSAPTSVTALATPTNQRPQVSWVAPGTPGFTVAHYRVYRNGVYLQNEPTTSFTDNSGGLADGSYTYQLIAADSGDVVTGVASAPVTVLYDTAAPAAPGGVAAGAALDGSVGVSWAASGDGTGSGIARYVVRRSLSATPPATTADGDATCQTTTTSCSDVAALNGKLYSYAVFAIDRAGNTSLAGNSAAVTARDQLAPAVPQGLSATPGDGLVDLRWTAAGVDDDVAGYVLVAKQGVQAPTSDTDGSRVCTTIVAASTTCQATGLTNGATYTFGLFALDEALNRSQPAVASAVPNGKVSDSKAPAAVSKLKAKVSGHRVTLTWKNPADHDFDHVEITAGQRKPAALSASTRVYSGKGTRATTTLAAGQSRWFVVVAYDHAGNASEPAGVHVTIAAPSRFGPAPRAKVHGRVKLTWPVVKGARYYNVQVYAGKKRILVGWPNGRALKLPRAKLKRGTTYTWYVWPGIGAKARAHYGKLIGKNVFTFTG